MKNFILSLNVDEDSNLIIEKTKLHQKIKEKYENLQCAICLDEFSVMKDDIVMLECSHKFCKICVEANKKQTKSPIVVCPICKKESRKGYVIDASGLTKGFMLFKESEINGKCSKCFGGITDEKYISCFRCGICFHGKCLKNFTKDMKKMVFLCVKCLQENFNDEIYHCSKCKLFITERRYHLIRHEKTCFSSLCTHCGKHFMNKKTLKIHLKEAENLKKNSLIMNTLQENEEKSLGKLMGRIDMEL